MSDRIPERIQRMLEIEQAARNEREALRRFIKASIKNRLAWANSEDGRRVLGPGSPTVPGLQDFYAILSFLDARDDSGEDAMSAPTR